MRLIGKNILKNKSWRKFNFKFGIIVPLSRHLFNCINPAKRDTEIPNSEFIIPNYLKAFSADFPVHDPPCQFIVSPAAFQPDSVFTAYIVLSAG